MNRIFHLQFFPLIFLFYWLSCFQSERENKNMFKIKLRFIPRSSRKNFSIFFWQHSDAYNMAAHKDNHWMGIRNGMTVFASSKVNELKLSSGREFEGTSQILTQRRYCCTSFTYSILWFLSTFTLVKEKKKKKASCWVFRFSQLSKTARNCKKNNGCSFFLCL